MRSITEALSILEIDADNRGTAKVVSLDPDDIDAAIKELDARYLAGEGAAHAHTWSVYHAGFNAAFNRHEIPATDWVAPSTTGAASRSSPSDLHRILPRHMGPHAQT